MRIFFALREEFVVEGYNSKWYIKSVFWNKYIGVNSNKDFEASKSLENAVGFVTEKLDKSFAERELVSLKSFWNTYLSAESGVSLYGSANEISEKTKWINPIKLGR